MPVAENNKPRVRICNHDMEAYLQIPDPDEGEKYTTELLEEALQENGVKAGIMTPVLQKMVAEQIYNQEMLVARGTPVKDGTDGYYDYNFNANCDKKPKILPDGTVDYWSVHSIESVVEGQVIAIYHPAIEGENGISVRGDVLTAKRGKEQSLLKGKGFERNNDGLTYISLLDGKIEMQNDKILILPVHELYGNADLSSGNIDFHGDIVIHGGVESGVKIKASGTITIDGVVESCTLDAGKDIILRSGMVGGNKAYVRTKGNVFAKFFEYTTVEAEGMIQADVLMNSKVTSKEVILLNGKRGSIIGGEVHAVQGIEVSNLGNIAETKTTVYAGAGDGINSRLALLEKKIQATKDGLVKVEQGLKQFDILEAERGISYANDPRRMSLLRVRIKDTAIMAADEAEVKRLKGLVGRSKGATVRVLSTVFPGVEIFIDDAKLTVKNNATNIEFYRLEDKIRTRTAE